MVQGTSYPPRPLDISIEAVGPDLAVRINGVVGESADFSAVIRAVEERGSKSVVLDLEGLQRFTSAGVGEWLKLVKQLDASCERIRLVHATDGFLIQCVMLPGFRGRAEIESVVVQFVCEDCYRARPTTLMRVADFPQGVPPERGEPCGDCGGATTLDAWSLSALF
jgi:hypothetical protein